MLLIVVVGGIAFGIAVQALLKNCTDNPSNELLYLVPSCGNLLATAVVGAIIGGIALGVGALLLRQANVSRARRVPLAAGLFVALVIVVAGIPALGAPPSPNMGTPPTLPFPIPAGEEFYVNGAGFGPYAKAALPEDPYAPWAVIEIQGAFNATSPVCVTVEPFGGTSRVNGGGVMCGSTLAFTFWITAATWTIAFSLEPQFPRVEFNATVIITQTVQVVY